MHISDTECILSRIAEGSERQPRVTLTPWGAPFEDTTLTPFATGTMGCQGAYVLVGLTRRGLLRFCFAPCSFGPWRPELEFGPDRQSYRQAAQQLKLMTRFGDLRQTVSA